MRPRRRRRRSGVRRARRPDHPQRPGRRRAGRGRHGARPARALAAGRRRARAARVAQSDAGRRVRAHRRRRRAGGGHAAGERPRPLRLPDRPLVRHAGHVLLASQPRRRGRLMRRDGGAAARAHRRPAGPRGTLPAAHPEPHRPQQRRDVRDPHGRHPVDGRPGALPRARAQQRAALAAALGRHGRGAAAVRQRPLRGRLLDGAGAPRGDRGDDRRPPPPRREPRARPDPPRRHPVAGGPRPSDTAADRPGDGAAARVRPFRGQRVPRAARLSRHADGRRARDRGVVALHHRLLVSRLQHRRLAVPEVGPDGATIAAPGSFPTLSTALSALLEPPVPDAQTTAGGRDLLRAVAAGTAGVVGEAFLRSLPPHVAGGFDADLAFVGEALGDETCRIRVVASWHRGGVRLPEGTEYELDGTPCALVREHDVVTFPDGARNHFPADTLLADHALDGYLAIAMRGAGGSYLGHLGVLARRRLDATDDEVAALTIFAARAAAEIERRRHEALLRAREAEVAASRARMVQAADDERRRIGRELHDGAQQRLLALGHLAGLALRRLADEPESAAALIERVREEATFAHTELRELARGLHPAGLAERGLGGALEALGARTPLPLRVTALPDRRLPDPIGVTIYAMVAEALANAMKHARASEVRVAVTQREREVVAEVADDGAGGADPAAGTGLLGLADRVAALGGRRESVSERCHGPRLAATTPPAPWRIDSEPFLEFGYEGDGGAGEERIARVMAGIKTVSVSLSREWDLEGGPPRVGQRLPMIDHAGGRRGTVEVQRVIELPFSEIGPEVVAADGAATSVEEWRARHRAFYDGCRDEVAFLIGEPGWRLAEEEPMVVLFYRYAGDETVAAAG